MTEQKYKEICAEVQNSGIPVPSQQRIIDACGKQVGKKPFQPFGTHSFKCSTCWQFVAHEVDDNCDLESEMSEWCPYCGQKLDWRDDNECNSI